MKNDEKRMNCDFMIDFIARFGVSHEMEVGQVS